MPARVPSLLLLLPLLAAAPPQDRGDSYLSEPVDLEHLPTSQVIGLGARPLLEEGLAIAGRRFAYEVDGERLLVATEPEAEPSVRVPDGGAVELRWLADGKPVARAVRLARDVEGRWCFSPATARAVGISGTSLFLIDADLDGHYTTAGRDGWCITLGAPLLPLQSHLIFGARRLTIGELAPDGSRLEARLQPLAGTPVQREALEVLNRFRLGQGLPGLDLETELSVGCSAHAAYLVANDWDGKSDPHDQPPHTPGGTVEGRIAGRASWIGPLPLARAAEVLCSSYPEAIALTDPALARIGLSDRQAGPAVIDLSSPGTHRSDPTIRWRPMLLSPSDGSIDFPTHFPSDALTEPVRNARRMGPPLFVRLADSKAGITDYTAELFALRGGSSSRLDTVGIEDEANPGILGALPRRPLKRNASYRVVHRFTADGEERMVSAVFRTR